MEAEVIEADILLPPVLPFKRTQMSEKYPKGHARGRHWKHLKQIIQAENYQNFPPNEPNCGYLLVPMQYIQYVEWEETLLSEPKVDLLKWKLKPVPFLPCPLMMLVCVLVSLVVWFVRSTVAIIFFHTAFLHILA